MHRSKGMEFSRVILAGIDDTHVPPAATLRAVPEEERAEALLRERSLLYVAASRARDELVVTWSGKRSGLLGASAAILSRLASGPHDPARQLSSGAGVGHHSR